MAMDKRYEELDHTADLRLRVFGATRKELFANAAFALFDRMLDLSGVGRQVVQEVGAAGADAEETLVNFLDELLYRYDTEGFIPRECEITRVADADVHAVCRGDIFDAARHEARAHIKAVTFHDVAITRAGDGLQVTLTCDV